MSDAVRKAKEYKSALAPIWCPGCGHYSVLNALTKALASRDAAKEDTVIVSGIGCSSRLPAYLDTYGFHGIHGRALPIATGLAVARPDLTVVAVGGDGDVFSIGGNHFLHACRRNVNLVLIAMDNEVYGMTKGQASPTSPADWDHAKLTPGGPGVRPFQPCAVALASGAGFIARGYSGDPNGLARMIDAAIGFEGFAFIHVLSQCVTFCPEQKEWKTLVREFDDAPTDDPEEAAHRLYAEDGFSKGVVYRRAMPAWRANVVTEARDVAEFSREFSL